MIILILFTTPIEMPSQKRKLDTPEWTAKKRRVTTLVASLVPNSRKRKLEEENGDEPPSKRHVSFSLPQEPSSSDRKRPLDEVDDVDEPQAKRQAVDVDRITFIDLKSRMELFLILKACKEWKYYSPILNISHKIGEVALALALNDSPEPLRLRALEKLNPDELSQMSSLISEIQLDKARFDPKSIFPSVITGQVINKLPKDVDGDKASCLICHRDFIPFSDVIWKGCGNHIMHPRCFRKRVSEGEIPLIGPCACIEEY